MIPLNAITFKALKLATLSLALMTIACGEIPNTTSDIELVILGVSQDAGRPHIACIKSCCINPDGRPKPHEPVIALGVTDGSTAVLIEATPDLPAQWNQLKQETGKNPEALFITHAHIGHYTGLMYLGREALGGQNVAVHVGPRMRDFLTENGPWSQLVELGQIQLHDDVLAGVQCLNKQVTITGIQVPHRDEYSETMGFLIQGPRRVALFIPDINKWDQWAIDLDSLIDHVDIALLDGTFYSTGETPNRDPSEIPHPFVKESMAMWSDWPAEKRSKVTFVHFNHSNPLHDPKSEASQQVQQAGFHVGQTGMRLPL